MELTGKRFCMVTDKELMLQILHMNNVPCLELIDPKTCKYPIVGRKYGHHNGKDLIIINTNEQIANTEADFFTKMYAISTEYMLEIEGLTVKGVYIAVGQEVVFNEVPIRTKAFGWKWVACEIDTIPEEWLAVAIRALYVTGLNNGFVKLGLLENESIIVTDINRANSTYTEATTVPKGSFTMGADIEFMLSCDADLLPASTFFSPGGEVGCDERQIEQDSGDYALVEIRPEKANTPQELFQHIKQIIHQASEIVPYENVEFRSGSMPFSGYQCGGHIHIGMPITLSILRAFDQFVAIPFSLIEDPQTAKKRRRTNHGGLGRYRLKPYGFEYIGLSSWIIDPKLALGVLSLAKLVALHHHELTGDFLENPIIQRAYYNSNHVILKQLWPEIKKQLQNTSSYPEYEENLLFLFDSIENGYPYSEKSDFRINWGLSITKQSFDRGKVILIPKKIRLKHDLTEGSTTYICAGNRITEATIRPYPFTFRNSNIIQLSKALKESLLLPMDWNPKISLVNGVITLGPIIGILAQRPFDRQTTYFHHIERLATEKQMLVYVFEPKDIDWNQQIIKGETSKGQGIFPFPAVIYDRLVVGKKDPIIDRIRAKLQHVYHIPFINPTKLSILTRNKWETHKLLYEKHEKILPDACLLQDTGDLIEKLNEYGEIYLKPVGGSLGKGILRVIRRPTGIFLLNIKEKKTYHLQTNEQLLSFVAPLMKEQTYLIQEGIRRKQYRGKNLEIRVYMQKNGQHKWFRTGMVTRLTAEDVMTEDTEINLRLSKVLKLLYEDPSERRSITQKLGNIARSIVTTIENNVGTFGEMAVDLCIDQYNSIKLLEVNSKPDNLFSQIGAYQLRNLAGIRLLNYAASLAGYEGEDFKV
ncbi:putative amidoligase domain-containing protein [Bacillus marasmi]|uniref:putative amidoligase domain-containing protein n=1 Tax=Bacillus marasmi TaxID=1926279 RepID=UPI0011CC4FB6|nr:YheC/YheD family protein [Bacillus marasmi]